MKSALLKPSLLAFAFATLAGSALAKDCASDPGPQAHTPTSAAPPYPAAGQVVYLNPFADLARMQAAMDREFNALNALWVPVMLAPPAQLGLPMQASSLQQTKDGYQLQVSVPGFKPEDVRVRLDGRLLTVFAQDSAKGTFKTGNGPEQAISTRSFVQTLTLPEGVEATGFKQNIQNGVLTITIPRQQVTPGRA